MSNQGEKINAVAEKTGLPVRWVSASTDEAEMQKAWAAGLTIANAARPLVGTVAWEGRFRAGVYYACGDFDDLGEHWARNDASEVRLISDAEVLRAVIVEGHKRGFGDKLKALLSKFTPDKLAEQAYCWFDMPFSTDLSAEDFQQLLADADWSVPDQ